MTEEIDERRARALCKLKCSLFACTQGKCLYWQDWLDGAKAIREADKAAINERKVMVERLRNYGRRPHVICKEAADYIDQLELDIKERDSRIATLEKYAVKLEAEISDTDTKIEAAKEALAKLERNADGADADA